MPSTPLFAFGHCLSYTTFQYSPLKLESDTVDLSGELRLSLTVTNTGGRRGTEVVQLYAADTATGVTLPAQQLIGFARVDRPERRRSPPCPAAPGRPAARYRERQRLRPA